jgi:hypothetical protein
MKVTVISKYFGSQVIDTDNFYPAFAPVNSPVFKMIEYLFNRWFDHNTQPGAPGHREIRGMYYGETGQPAIYSKMGAIRHGIEILLEEISERGLEVVTTKDIMTFDIECAFE